MEYVKLKNSDLTVSRICMGGCPMGGYGWGYVRKGELLDTVHTAIDNGINFFDTADIYGIGESERILGEALGNKRKDVVIATKFGVRIIDGKTIYDNTKEWIRKAIEESLKRLRTDYIDVYQIHYYDGMTPLDEIKEALSEIKNKGYVRYFGLSNIHNLDLKTISEYKNRIVSFQEEFSLACRKNEQDIRRIINELEITPMTWGSLGQGILTGKYTKDNIHFGEDDRRSRDTYVNFHGEKLDKNLRIVEVLKELSKKYERPVAAVAVRFILDYFEDSVVLCGAKKPEQIMINAEGADWHLDADDMKILIEVSNDK